MSAQPQPRIKPPRRDSERGAALLISLLLTLVLAALGIVAIQTGVRGMNQAGNYRMRKQAQLASEGAVLYVSGRVGDRATSYWSEIQRNRDILRRTSPNVALNTEIDGYVTVGRFMDAQNNQVDTYADTLDGEGTRLYSDQAMSSHEEQFDGASYRVILRDPIEGPPMAGSDGKFCYKKVMFVSEIVYGQPSSEWIKPSQASRGSNSVEALIGPIECSGTL